MGLKYGKTFLEFSGALNSQKICYFRGLKKHLYGVFRGLKFQKPFWSFQGP
jgi:hypothetical protein